MKASTAQALREALLSAAREGTGSPGAPENGTAGIKTGTAQTGVYEEGEELLHFWYCGFVCDSSGPRWCVAVLKESSQADGGVAARVFQQVAEGLISLEGGETGETAGLSA